VAISTLAKSSIGTFDKFNKTSGGNLVAGPAMFVMSGPYTSTNSAATSNDGITWTLRTLTGFGSSYGITKVGNTYINITSGGARGAVDPTVNSTFPLAGGFGLISVNGGFVGADYINNNWVYWSDYGFAAGAFINSTSQINTRAVAFGNNTWVVVYNGSTYYATSTNSFTISPLANFAFAQSNIGTPEKVIFANGLFVATGSGGISTSPDGITWTQRSSAGDFRGGRVVYAGGLYIAAINGGNLFTSPNGITWTSRSPVFSSSQFVGAAFGAGIYAVLSSTGQLWSSPDGTTWTTRTNPLAGGNWWTGSSVNGPSMLVFG
jgi:hypothetical protein